MKHKLKITDRMDAALHIIVEEIILRGGWLENPEQARKDIILRAKKMDIDPDELFEMVYEHMYAHFELAFRPIDKKIRQKKACIAKTSA